MDDRRSHRLLHVDGAMSCHAEPNESALRGSFGSARSNRGSSPMISVPATPSVVREILDTELMQEMKESTNRSQAARRPLPDAAHPQARTPATASGRVKTRGLLRYGLTG